YQRQKRGYHIRLIECARLDSAAAKGAIGLLLEQDVDNIVYRHESNYSSVLFQNRDGKQVVAADLVGDFLFSVPDVDHHGVTPHDSRYRAARISDNEITQRNSAQQMTCLGFEHVTGVDCFTINSDLPDVFKRPLNLHFTL